MVSHCLSDTYKIFKHFIHFKHRTINYFTFCKLLFYVFLANVNFLTYICIREGQYTIPIYTQNAMKTIFTLILALVLTLTLSGPKVCWSQTVAIGHVSAEIIESVSASSNAVSNFELASLTVKDTKKMEQNLTSETLKLGMITINSGRDITCNVVVKSASLFDSAGNGFTVAPELKNETFASVASSNGSRTLELNGRTSRTSDQPSGLYQGSYTVVFAYN